MSTIIKVRWLNGLKVPVDLDTIPHRRHSFLQDESEREWVLLHIEIFKTYFYSEFPFETREVFVQYRGPRPGDAFKHPLSGKTIKHISAYEVEEVSDVTSESTDQGILRDALEEVLSKIATNNFGLPHSPSPGEKAGDAAHIGRILKYLERSPDRANLLRVLWDRYTKELESATIGELHRDVYAMKQKPPKWASIVSTIKRTQECLACCAGPEQWQIFARRLRIKWRDSNQHVWLEVAAQT
jgi:hypothetical protein